MDIYGDMGVLNSLRKRNHILLELLNIIGTRGQNGGKNEKGNNGVFLSDIFLYVKGLNILSKCSSESYKDSLIHMNVILFPMLIELRFFPREKKQLP